MKLSRDERDWQDLAEMDPMWAVLSSPGKQHGGWDNEEFLSSGRTEIVGVIARADALGLPRRRGAALDFGCGAGRLTRPLAECFESYVGVDISEEMLSNARRVNADVCNATYVHNTGTTLPCIADRSIDLVYSRIVLQHVSRLDAIRSYLFEFARVLADDGLLCVQLPSAIPPRHRLQIRPRVYGVLRRLRVPSEVLYENLRLQPMRMRFLPVPKVVGALEGSGLEVVDVETLSVSGIVSSTYYATRG